MARPERAAEIKPNLMVSVWFLKAKTLNQSMTLITGISRGARGRGFKPKGLPWGGYGYSLKHYSRAVIKILSY